MQTSFCSAPQAKITLQNGIPKRHSWNSALQYSPNCSLKWPVRHRDMCRFAVPNGTHQQQTVNQLVTKRQHTNQLNADKCLQIARLPISATSHISASSQPIPTGNCTHTTVRPHNKIYQKKARKVLPMSQIKCTFALVILKTIFLP